MISEEDVAKVERLGDVVDAINRIDHDEVYASFTVTLGLTYAEGYVNTGPGERINFDGDPVYHVVNVLKGIKKDLEEEHSS